MWCQKNSFLGVLERLSYLSCFYLSDMVSQDGHPSCPVAKECQLAHLTEHSPSRNLDDPTLLAFCKAQKTWAWDWAIAGVQGPISWLC